MDSSKGKKNVLLAAHTNKNWHGLKQNIEKAITDTKINLVEDQQELEEEVKKKKEENHEFIRN